MVYALAGMLGVTAIAAPPIVRAAVQSDYCKWGQSPLGRLISGHIGRWMVLRSVLNLTDEQKAKLKEAVKPHKAEIAKAAKGVWEKRTALVGAVLAEQPDEQAIRHAADELGKAIGDAAVLASKVVGDVRPVLTSKQREQLEKFRQDCQTATDRFFQQVTKAE
jgi:Spy/CpxP family protein refolding chaperone